MPLAIVVQDNGVISMAYADGSPLAATDPNHRNFLRHGTVEQLFSELQAAPSGDADEVIVTYDRVRGFPSDIYIDFTKSRNG